MVEDAREGLTQMDITGYKKKIIKSNYKFGSIPRHTAPAKRANRRPHQAVGRERQSVGRAKPKGPDCQQRRQIYPVFSG